MKNILVFPCGSEVALEIYRSLKYSTHFKLFGGSSVDDHGRFVFSNYIGNLPFYNDRHFIESIKEVIKTYKIDAIYPAMDAVADTFKINEAELACRVIGSPQRTTSICASKRNTYSSLKDYLPVPDIYESLSFVDEYPIVIKPDKGYGSRNVHVAKSRLFAEAFLQDADPDIDFLLCEFLPGDEYTIDSFTDRHGKLLFCGGRKRARISNGISVNTKVVSEYRDYFQEAASTINSVLELRGAWFFQMKLDKRNNLKLLEVAARLGGSSSLFRSQGVNFAMLSAFDCFDIDVTIIQNSYETELDRALCNKYKITIDYSKVYVDYDDCLLMNGEVNSEMISFIFSAINQNKNIILLTKHAENIEHTLKKHRLYGIFDQIIHLKKDDDKPSFIDPEGAIFIDDSFVERNAVKQRFNIPVFSPDMIEVLAP
jgi:hypothetical protein